MIVVLSNDLKWMQQAITLAEKAAKIDEVPVGAVIVLDEKVIGEAHNLVRTNHDPCAHAEILAIRQACNAINNEFLINAILYVTLEPCLMCMGAILHAHISRLVFGARDFKAGAAGSRWNFADGAHIYHKVQVDEGIYQDTCTDLLVNFFRKLR